MVFEYENKKKVRLGNFVNYYHCSKISGKFSNLKKSNEQPFLDRIFDFIRRNPQTAISLINLAIALMTLISQIIKFLIILYK